MSTVQDPRLVRALVDRTLIALGAEESELDQLIELILIQDGVYYGRSYRTPRLFAVWLVAAHLVQFYDEQASMLRTLSLVQADRSSRAA